MSFKVGDICCHKDVPSDIYGPAHFIHKDGRIEIIDELMSQHLIYFPENLILLSVYNSPLFKLLQE